MHRILIASLFALSACSTPAPGIEIRTVTVDRPVAIACPNRSLIPSIPPTIESERGRGWASKLTASQAADLLAAALLETRGRLREAVAILEGCAG